MSNLLRTGQPLVSATVQIVDSPASTQTDEDGNFAITTSQQKGQLRIQYLGFKVTDVNFTLSQTSLFQINLEPETRMIEEVEISTGYQTIPRERATGSFEHVDSTLFNRSFSTDVLSRLEGVASGVLFNRNDHLATEINIRGVSTIQANSDPLVILDNFEYNGDIRNINPNDVLNVTILKDAAAASIWGARAGNGVIVITTKSGNFNQPTKVNITSNFSFQSKPNLLQVPIISSSDYIDLEIELYPLCGLRAL